MKVSRALLARIVQEELVRYIGTTLSEAPKPPPEEIPDPEAAPEEPTGMPELEPPEAPDQPIGDDPADQDLAQDDAGEEPPAPGGVAEQVKGKIIQSIQMADSKMMPGATEVVLTFNDTEDALRILLTRTGRVKFFFRGLHNDLGEPGGPPEDDRPESQVQAPDDIEDVPDGDSTVSVDTPRPPSGGDEDEEGEEDIEV